MNHKGPFFLVYDKALALERRAQRVEKSSGSNHPPPEGAESDKNDSDGRLFIHLHQKVHDHSFFGDQIRD